MDLLMVTQQSDGNERQTQMCWTPRPVLLPSELLAPQGVLFRKARLLYDRILRLHYTLYYILFPCWYYTIYLIIAG